MSLHRPSRHEGKHHVTRPASFNGPHPNDLLLIVMVLLFAWAIFR